MQEGEEKEEEEVEGEEEKEEPECTYKFNNSTLTDGEQQQIHTTSIHNSHTDHESLKI